MHELGWALFVVLSLLGLVGVILPGLPGAPLGYAGVLALAWTHGFERIGPWTLIVMGVLTALVSVLELVASAMGAKKLGGSKWGVAGALVGGLVGIFLGPAGLLFGALAGAVGAEMIAGRTSKEALRAGWGTFLGFVASAVVEGAFCLAMIVAAVIAHVW
jgi:uncharacterized protein YqgC (DUF456 family)